ncbi:hypothetical protein ANCCEY_15788, partial [Ancylostoma ceylanicum]
HLPVVLSRCLRYVVTKWCSHVVNHNNSSAAIHRPRPVVPAHSRVAAAAEVKCQDCADDAVNGQSDDYLVFAGLKYAKLPLLL